MRWAILIGLALAASVASGPTAAWADDDDDATGYAVPAGRLGASIGLRTGLGRLSSDFGLGLIGSIEAGYHPTPIDRRLSFGIHWAVRRGWFGNDDEASVAGSLQLTEFDFGGRVRLTPLLSARRFVTLGAGVSLLRTNVPIPPDDERVYIGPYGSLAIEASIFGYLVGAELRYGMIGIGPGSLSFSVGVSLGT